jgi:hypothetical protein
MGTGRSPAPDEVLFSALLFPTQHQRRPISEVNAPAGAGRCLFLFIFYFTTFFKHFQSVATYYLLKKCGSPSVYFQWLKKIVLLIN